MGKRRNTKERTGHRFVTIRRVHDVVEAGMLVDLLAEEGIPALTPGLDHAGAMGNLLTPAFEIPLRVPEPDAARAKEILAALDDYDEMDPGDVPAPEMDATDGPYRGGRKAEPVPDRKPVAVVAVALILPLVLAVFGAGHFYVRRYPAGFGFLAVGWFLLFLGFAGVDAAFLGLPALIAVDAWGATRTLRRA